MTWFHFILPSHSSMKIYQNNKVNNYVTALSNRIAFDEDEEVALSEIMFPHSWFIDQPDECLLYLKNNSMQPSASVFLAHAKVLESGSAKYLIRRAACKTYVIPAGNLGGNHEKLFTSHLPSRLVMGCVDNDAFNGSYTKNPYKF